MIVARSPRHQWKPNANGETRSIADACRLAREWGVEIPADVEFHVAPPGYPMGEDTYARTTIFREFDGTIIEWERLYNNRGKIPFLIREDVLRSDEAIVAVIAHEVYELERLRREFDSREPIEKWQAETSPTRDGNFHCQAWDYADSLVEKMERCPMIDSLLQMYREGAITRYQIMIDCLHRIDPEHPELVLEGLPEEVYDELLEYASRYDPRKPAPKERLMPAADQVDAATTWIARKRGSERRKGDLVRKA